MANVFVGLLLVFLAALPLAAAPLDVQEPEKLLFLLEYIGLDYGAAVQDGQVINVLEYDEMLRFSDTLVAHFDVLRRHGAPEEVGKGLLALQREIRARSPASEIATLSGTLVEQLFDRPGTVSVPAAPPVASRGAPLYAQSCAPCHGERGRGDGWASSWLDPPPTSFDAERLNRLSPHQVFSAILFGIDGTPMPSYRGALTRQQIWDVAFHLMTLREDFNPVPPPNGEPPSLTDLVGLSHDDLLAQVERGDAAFDASGLDYYLANPPRALVPDGVHGGADRGSEEEEPLPDDPDLQLAIKLQDAFGRVADQVFPSVVGVTSFVRDEHWQPTPPERASDGSWIAPHPEEQIYPGFRRNRSGSGFFVDSDGHVLTCYHLLVDADGELVDAFDVELPGGRHIVSRVVGVEPTINLAILQLAAYSKRRPPSIRPVLRGDSQTLQLGHWSIALGDPWGTGRTYTVGTVASPPDRQCYQEQLTATLIRSSLRLNPEDYGGPLVNIRGEVVGMSVPDPRGVDPARAYEFALPINLALGIFDALVQTDNRRSPWLGFSVLELAALRKRTSQTGERISLPMIGVYIDNLFEPSPAASAGVRVGDSLVAIDGNRLLSVLDFQKWLYLSGVGRTVTLQLYRDGKTLEKTVRIEERPTAAGAR